MTTTIVTYEQWDRFCRRQQHKAVRRFGVGPHALTISLQAAQQAVLGSCEDGQTLEVCHNWRQIVRQLVRDWLHRAGKY